MRTLLLLFFIVLFSNCSSVQKNYIPVNKIKWLEGKWQQKMPNTILFEEWKMINNDYLIGRSYQVKNLDTIYIENLKIFTIKEGKSKKTVYQAEVFNQNEGKAIQFVLRNQKEKIINNLWFDNKNHNFPQHINYHLKHSDTIYAQIEGVNKVGFKNVKFKFVRVK